MGTPGSQGNMKQLPEPTNRSTRCVTFKCTSIRGQVEGLVLKKDDMIFSNKLRSLVIKNLLNQSLKVDVSRLIIRWSPLVEPSTESTLCISVSYDMIEDSSELTNKDMICVVKGKIAETHQITIHPTKSLIFERGSKFRFPWIIDIDTDNIMQDASSPVIGLIKIWCFMELSAHDPMQRVVAKRYVQPHIEWSNEYFPYYIPAWVCRRVRGADAANYQKTLAYLTFGTEIRPHCSPVVLPPECVVHMMQTLSHDDVNKFHEITKDCNLRKGGSFCSCKSNADKFVTEVLANSKQTYAQHAMLFSNIEHQTSSGRMSGSINLPAIKF
nr:MAG: movement protein [Taraxacum betanucleorhabdovirus 1]